MCTGAVLAWKPSAPVPPTPSMEVIGVFAKDTGRRGASVPGVSAEDIVKEWDRRHGPHRDAWMLGEVVVVLGLGVWVVLRAVLRHPLVALALGVVALSYWS